MSKQFAPTALPKDGTAVEGAAVAIEFGTIGQSLELGRIRPDQVIPTLDEFEAQVRFDKADGWITMLWLFA